MAPKKTEYIQKQYQNSNEWKEVKHLSDEIFKFIKDSKKIKNLKLRSRSQKLMMWNTLSKF